MTMILAKQVEGMLDRNSKQDVAGEKTFKASVIFEKQNGEFHIKTQDGFLYWCTRLDVLSEEGNARLGMINSQLTVQYYSEGRWAVDGK